MPIDPAELQPPSKKHAVALTKIRDGQCRFITAEPTRAAICCGAPTNGGSWCAWHRRIVFAGAMGERLPQQRQA
ncbi:MAG TPA: hypothetical protein VF601_06615 [Beijerinckiaceae bacterium]|jgi:hypothetical protein